MGEEQLTRNRRLLELKGVPVEEEPPEPKVDSAAILERYKRKKDSTKAATTEWDVLDPKWNPDNTLSRLTAYKNGEVLYEMDFAWNADGTLSKIMRVDGR
jgi:hypothetical protein